MTSRTDVPVGDLFRARLEKDIRKRTRRLEFVRGRLGRGDGGEMTVLPLTGQESHKLGVLARADCLILFPREETLLSAGSIVNVEPLDWSTP